jgi:hypothetical protein
MTDDSQVTYDPKCTICSIPKSHHEGFRHPFSDPTRPIGASQVFGKTRTDRIGGSGRGPAVSGAQIAGELTVEHAAFPFDPVLRQALVTKGVITYQDLEEAEHHIRSVTNNLVKGEK